MADGLSNVEALLEPGTLGSVWADTAWLAGYVAAALGLTHPSVADPPAPIGPPSGRRADGRLVALGVAATVPGVTLLVGGPDDAVRTWLPVGIGMVTMAGLVLVRMAVLLRQVQRQAEQLEELARIDALTGTANRRTWDHELARAAAAADATGSPLAVALLDLDHFKDYNDAHGHQAGDRLLRGCAKAWQSALGSSGTLARYGGEEFAVLLPGHDAAAATSAVERLRRATPAGSTVSAGVAVRRPGEAPAHAVAAADAALYESKRQGRDKVRAAADSSTAVGEPPTRRAVGQRP